MTRASVQQVNIVALSFYDEILRNDANLRRMCTGRQSLNYEIDMWKERKALHGEPVMGVSRSDILRSLKTKWNLISRESNISASVNWTVDGTDGGNGGTRAGGRNRNRGVRGDIDNVSLSFYDAKLRNDAELRRRCSDRHVLDATIDRWKAEERLDGRPITGASRANIIRSLCLKWRLIHTRIQQDNVIIWTADMDSDADSADDDSQQANSAGDQTDRIARTVARIRNSRAELESNRNGVVIEQIDFGVQDAVCRVGHRAVQQVEIRNESDIDMVCDIKADAAVQRNFTIAGEMVFDLPAGGATSISVGYTPRSIGVTKTILVFNFDPACCDEEDEIEPFSIVRYILIRGGDPDDFDMLKPTAPYVKKFKNRDDQEKFSNPVRVRSNQNITPFENPLASYNIPQDIQKLARNENEAMQVLDSVFRGDSSYFDRSAGVDYSSTLKIDNYAECMHKLLWLEEAQMNVDITNYDLSSAPLLREGRVFKLHVPGLAENRPSVLKGDKILIRVGVRKYEGIVTRTTQEYAYLDFPRSFTQSFIPGTRADVRFTFSRTTLRTSHQALKDIDVKEYGSPHHKITFPKLLGRDNLPLTPLNTRIIRIDQLRFFNPNLNEEQKTAVLGVIQSVARPAPYLIYGPPGTGKTVTLVESILQTKFAVSSDRKCKILVCAPSNTAVDVVVERLAPHVNNREMMRLMAYSRDKATVPSHILQYTNYDEDNDCFITPHSSIIMRFSVVATTIASAGKLPNNGIINHFHHVFIDEAGHSIEAEALACLVSVTKQDDMSPPAVTLAGDPKQLGPIIRSEICKTFGLGKSLLERLSQMKPYARTEDADNLGNHYDRRMITRLVHNYRSHPEILLLPNQLFYDGDLIRAADRIRSHRFINWEHLPKRGFPIIFHGIVGEDTREANSPSWFNPDEAQIVKMYVDLLVNGTRTNRCRPEEIGVIAPYHRQVQKIRMLLNAHGFSETKVGSVEEFQGSERPVIIISTVRSTTEYISFDLNHKLGFLSNEKRFNVAVTRAQSLLIMVGNPFTLETDDNWKALINHAFRGGGYTGVEYTPQSGKRQYDRSVAEDVFHGFHDSIADTAGGEEDSAGGFVMVSHVTAQEGPSWARSEE